MNNDKDIKRVVGRNFTESEDKESKQEFQEEEPKKSSVKNIKPKKTSEKKQKNDEEESIPLYKRLNLIPFAFFVIFALVVIWQKDTLVPPKYTQSVQKETSASVEQPKEEQVMTPQETTTEKTEKENEETTDEESEQELSWTNDKTEIREEGEESKLDKVKETASEMVEKAEEKIKHTAEELKPSRPQLTQAEQMQIAGSYKNEIINIIRRNWHPSTERAEGNDWTVIYELTIDKKGINRKLTKSVITGTIHNRAFDAIYDSMNSIPQFPEELGNKIIRFDVIFNKSSISSSDVIIADRIEDLPYTPEYQLF